MALLRRSPTSILALLGVLSVAGGFVLGGRLVHGFGTPPSAYLVHGGLYALLLAGTTTVLDRFPLGDEYESVATAVVAFVLLFFLSVGLFALDVAVLRADQYSTEYSLLALAIDRLSLVLPLSILVTGYVAGRLARLSSGPSSLVVPGVAVAFALGGPLLGYYVELWSMAGGHPGFVAMLYAVMTAAAVAGAILLFLVAWRVGDTE